MTQKEELYTIEEAKSMLHEVVMQESKKLENHLKKQDQRKAFSQV